MHFLRSATNAFTRCPTDQWEPTGFGLYTRGDQRVNRTRNPDRKREEANYSTTHEKQEWRYYARFLAYNTRIFSIFLGYLTMNAMRELSLSSSRIGARSETNAVKPFEVDQASLFNSVKSKKRSNRRRIVPRRQESHYWDEIMHMRTFTCHIF